MENVPSSGGQRRDTRRRRIAMRWMLWREPRIVDYIAIAVIASLLVAGGLWIGSVAAQSGGKPRDYSPTQQLDSGRDRKTQEKGATGLAEPVYLDDLPKENGSH